MVGIFTGLGSGLVRGSGASLGAAGILGSSGLGRGGENVSVNAATGNLIVSRQDEFLTGSGIDVGISRTYNGFGETSDRDNGDNWQQSTTLRIFDLVGTPNTPGSTVKRLGADGSVVTYSWGIRDGVAAYWTTDGSGSHDRLTRSGDQWQWTDGDTRIVETYDVSAGDTAEWRLIERKDKSSKRLTFSYLAGTDKLDRVTTADGSWLSYVWSGANITRIETGFTDLATSTAKTLTRTWYDYSNGRLSQVRVDLTPDDNASPNAIQSYWTRYTYDGAGRLSTIVQKDGSQVDVTYDALGRVTTLTQQVATDDVRVTTLTYGTNTTAITAPNGRITRLEYDTNKQLTKITAPPAYNGAEPQVVQFGYDADGNVTTITDAAGKVTTNAYDADGNITKTTDPNGNTVERWYDSGNQVIRELTYGSSATGDTVPKNTRYAYDPVGRLRYVVNAEGNVTEYRYNVGGEVEFKIEYPEHSYPVGHANITEVTMNAWRNEIGDRSSSKMALYLYDARGNLRRTVGYGIATVEGGLTGVEGHTRVDSTYDEGGRLIARNALGEAAESYVYDGMGRLTAVTDVHGGTTTFVFNDTALTTTVTTSSGFTKVQIFNKAGDLVSTTGSGSGQISGTATLVYDKNGRLRVSIDETGNKSFLVYDRAGQLVGEVNAYGHLTEYRRDAAGRIIAEVRYFASINPAYLTTLENPDNTLQMQNLRPGAHAYDLWNWTVYDAAGRTVQVIGGDGGVTAFEYDKSDQLIKTINYATKVDVAELKATPPTDPIVVAANAADTINRNFYNRNGQLIGTLDGEGYLSEITYDAAGQKVEELAYVRKTNAALWASGTISQLRVGADPAHAFNRRTRYVYDGQGLLRYLVDNAGQVTSYTHNYAGKLTSTIAYAAPISTTDFTYDNVKALVSSIANEATDREAYNVYDAIGRLAYSINADNAVTGFAYDGAGRVIKTVQFAIRRDTPGLPHIGPMDTWAANQAGNSANRISRNYYSAGGQLRFSVDAEGFVRRLDYDSAGRNTRVVTWDNAISVTDATTISQVNSLTTGSWVDMRMEYDQQGRLSSTYDALGNRTYQTYFPNGKLAYVHNAYGTEDQTTTFNVYDGAGRLKTQYNALNEGEVTATHFAYDGLGNLISTTDARGKVTSYTYDEVGRVISVTDALGGTITHTYNAFGEVTETIDARGGSTTNIYNTLGQITRTNDAASIVTDYSYSAFGEMATVSRGGATSSFEYDKLGRVTRSTDALEYFQTYTYDAHGNRLTVTAKSSKETRVAGGVTSYTYDRLGRLVSETLPIDSVDAAGQQSSQPVRNTYSYDARGNRITMVEASGLAEQRTTQYAYDKANRLISTTGQTFQGMTPVTTFDYDARGNLTRSTDPTGARTINYYDDLGRITATIDANGTYSATTYDSNGNVVKVRVYETQVTVPANGGSQEEAPVPTGAYRETTFAYDSLNRMTSSSVTGVSTGYFNGSTWVATTGALTTTYEYDAAGNVVKATDPNGNTTWSYYDLLNNKTAQIDSEGYRTSWAYSHHGNVISEHRYAIQSASPTSTLVPPEAPASHADDRITSFGYDMHGNRTSEARTGVAVHNGSGGASTVTSIVRYSYNGLGQVTRKTEGTGDFIEYEYDAGGRLQTEKRRAYSDHLGQDVTPQVDYDYDGLGNLTRTIAAGSSNTTARVTTYGYEGGHLVWMADSETGDANDSNGRITRYEYDVAGRVITEYYQRFDATGTLAKAADGTIIAHEATQYVYDASGRVIQQFRASRSNAQGIWVDVGPRSYTDYNAYGEVIRTGLNSSDVAANARVWQQENRYDNAGRLVSTSSGDGVWKHFGYDRNGNQTLAIASAGADLKNHDTQSALAMIGQDDVNATYTRYDKRNLALSIVEEGRKLALFGAAQTLTTHRSYNAFGEVVSETNALGATVDYSYNTMGKLIRTESPTVSITLENGTAVNVRPTEHQYYDASGRLVAARDANGNLTRLTLLSGSGYGGSQALVTRQINADGGQQLTGYDIHGDARLLTDELGFKTEQTFDKMGRLIQRTELRAADTSDDDFTSYYAYDGLGQQIRHWDSFRGGGDAQITDYDIQGRVVRSRAFGGDITSVSYSWDGALATNGLGTFGGWVERTTMANALYSEDKTDMFGRSVTERDLGGHTNFFTYDVAGRLAASSLSGMATSFTWLNSGHLAKMTIASPEAGSSTASWTRDVAIYTYDSVGNKLTELLTRTEATYERIRELGDPRHHEELQPEVQDVDEWSYSQTMATNKNSTATYDALGRLKTVSWASASLAPAASIANEYDAAGNIRVTKANYSTLSATGSSSPKSRNYWFTYDSMNRVVINEGHLTSDKTITSFLLGQSDQGEFISYNAAGQRQSVSGASGREIYRYDAAGRLSSTEQTASSSATSGTVRSRYAYDGAGRQTSQTDYASNGTTVVFNRTATFNAKGQLTKDTSSTLKNDGKTHSSTTNYYLTDKTSGQYLLGAVGWSRSTSSVTGTSGSTTSETVNSYYWRGGALQSRITYKPDYLQSTSYNTVFTYNRLGQLEKADINDGKQRDAYFTNDELGQVIRRHETSPTDQTGAPTEAWYRFNGRQLGYTGNNGTSDMSMADSISDRKVNTPTDQGTFRNKLKTGSSHADFAQSYDPINSFSQGSAGGSYTAQQGDTLQSIAQGLYGDSALWYKIAEINGLGTTSGLIEGQVLTLPTGVIKSRHNAGTLKPYNPAETLGDLTPDTSPKPKKKKCGVLGQVLLSVVAVAVSLALPGGGTVIGAAINGAIGSVVSQTIGVATGIQDKFSFKGVAMAAIGAGVGSALKGVQVFGKVAEGAEKSLRAITNAAATGAMSSAIIQGIGIVTGFQNKFSWAGVAAAGIAAGVGQRVGGRLKPLSGDGASRSLGNIGNHTAVGAASLLASAATRSAIEGSSFGKNIMASLPDVIGQAIGKAIGGAVSDKVAKIRRFNMILAQLQLAQASPITQPGQSPVMTDGGPPEIRVIGSLVPNYRALTDTEVTALQELDYSSTRINQIDDLIFLRSQDNSISPSAALDGGDRNRVLRIFSAGDDAVYDSLKDFSRRVQHALIDTDIDVVDVRAQMAHATYMPGVKATQTPAVDGLRLYLRQAALAGPLGLFNRLDIAPATPPTSRGISSIGRGDASANNATIDDLEQKWGQEAYSQLQAAIAKGTKHADGTVLGNTIQDQALREFAFSVGAAFAREKVDGKTSHHEKIFTIAQDSNGYFIRGVQIMPGQGGQGVLSINNIVAFGHTHQDKDTRPAGGDPRTVWRSGIPNFTVGRINDIKLTEIGRYQDQVVFRSISQVGQINSTTVINWGSAFDAGTPLENYNP